MNPIEKILAHHPICILDGAFATELERRGYDLNDPLWSAKILIEQPAEIQAVHHDYFKAGADCVITSSYQATFEGFRCRGLSDDRARELMVSSVTLARKARDRFWENHDRRKERPRPLVAASVGPYGAYLADGSEYRGNYQLDQGKLMQFHRQRLRTLVDAGPDILACETIPCLAEAAALVRLLQETPGVSAWFSFSARDGRYTCNGERLSLCAELLDTYPQVAAIGINCTAPEHIESLIDEIGRATSKPIIVYPNGGDIYDSNTKTWQVGRRKRSFSEYAKAWHEKGARVIGGCCRTGPEDIYQIASWARGGPFSRHRC